MDMADADGKGGDNHYSPNKIPTKGGFGEFLYNKEKGEVLGRTGLSWVKILFFYVIFFIGLACFSGLCYFIFYTTTLNLKTPRWQGTDGLIGGNPGIGFRPLPDQDKYPESTLIWINVEQELTLNDSEWGTQVHKFITHEVYTKPKGTGLNCNFTNNEKAREDAYCNVTVTDEALGDCASSKDGYGYTNENGSICVIIKLNKIYDWVPQPYGVGDLEKADKIGMPKEIQVLIKNLTEADNAMAKRMLETVWISCEGENPGDKEAMGNITIITPNMKNHPGIPNYYFPYKNQEGYQPPFVLVKFQNPRKNTLIQVECKGWAKNIEAERQLRLGSTHFELMIDQRRPRPKPAPPAAAST